MADWEKLVRQRLGLELDKEEQDDIHAELATHLEDSYESLRSKGVPEQAAIRQTLEQIVDCSELQRRIHLAKMGKDTMTNRVTQLWFPGLLTFFLSMSLETLAQKFGPQPYIFSLSKGTPVLMFYTAWLFALPVAGALGAYLANRAGGSRRTMLVSSIFPVLPLAIVFLIAIPAGLVMSHSLEHHVVAGAFLTLGIGWVLIPGAALLAGGLVVQLIASRRSASRGAVAR